MTQHEFELKLDLGGSDRDFLDEIADALIDAGCDDATFLVRSGVPHAQFTRTAESLQRAVASAILQVESVRGIRVAGIHLDEFLTASALAERLGRSRQNIHQWISSTRGPGAFPQPVSWVVGTRVWSWLETADWLEAHGQEQIDRPTSEDVHYVEALNGVLMTKQHLMDRGLEDEVLEALWKSLTEQAVGGRRPAKKKAEPATA